MNNDSSSSYFLQSVEYMAIHGHTDSRTQEMADVSTTTKAASTPFSHSTIVVYGTWATLAFVFLVMAVCVVVALILRLRSQRERRRKTLLLKTFDVAVQYKRQSTHREVEACGRKSSVFTTLNTEIGDNRYENSPSPENDIYEKDSENGSCRVEFSAFSATNFNNSNWKEDFTEEVALQANDNTA